MTQVNFTIDDTVKADAEALFSHLGVDIPTAVTNFIHHALYYGGRPFEMRINDPFYHPKNLAHLRKAKDDYEAGRNFSEHELIEVDEA